MNEVLEYKWADMLKLEGIRSKGYGIVPKAVMTDPAISYTAKAIYAYLCSLAGQDRTAFPTRETITRQLGMNKDTFYKHLNALTEAGYIVVSKKVEAGSGTPFAHNVYTLADDPKGWTPADITSAGEGNSLLVTSGILSAGYGLIPRLPMRDSRLKIRAKALYAYICSFAGAGKVAFPKQQDLFYHLDMSRRTYQSAMQELVACNYIEAYQENKDGRFSAYHYIIVSNPDIVRGQQETERRAKMGRYGSATRVTEDHEVVSSVKAETPGRKISDTDKQVPKRPGRKKPDAEKTPRHKISDGEFSDAQISDIQVSDVGLSDVQIPAENSNRQTTNSSPIITHHINSSDQITAAILDGIEDDEERKRYIVEDLLELPELGLEYHQGILSMIDIIVRCSRKKELKIKGEVVPRNIYMPIFLRLGADDYLQVIQNISHVKNSIQNKEAYIISCLFTFEEDIRKQAELDAAIF